MILPCGDLTGRDAPWSVALMAGFSARFYWLFEGVNRVGRWSVAAKVFTGLQTVAASAFAADKLTLVPALHFTFADEATLTVKAGMTAPCAECLSRIADRREELRAAAGIAAAMP
jgi:hypothetical protein